MTSAESRASRRLSPLENRIPPPLAVVLIGVVMAIIALPSRSVPLGGVTRLVIGGVAIALGGLVVVHGARTFWKAGTTINPVRLDQTSALVTTGLFRYTRNPMYVGFTAVLVGWAACLGSPWTLLGPVVFVLFTDRFQIIPEERVMREKFGPAYAAYCSHVRRWL